MLVFRQHLLSVKSRKCWFHYVDTCVISMGVLVPKRKPALLASGGKKSPNFHWEMFVLEAPVSLPWTHQHKPLKDSCVPEEFDIQKKNVW